MEWKKDKVNRYAISNPIHHGGLNMPIIDTFFESIKTSWVPKLITKEGKWLMF